jgi:hypothetical protein
MSDRREAYSVRSNKGVRGIDSRDCKRCNCCCKSNGRDWRSVWIEVDIGSGDNRRIVLESNIRERVHR